jgi:hypothetical protein
MCLKRILRWIPFLLLLPPIAQAQIDEDELGAWYMYLWSAPLDARRLGFPGDIP